MLSTFACSFPVIVRRFPKLPIPNQALFLSRHFGTGVLIATAFVHLLPTAYISLTDECLPPFWNYIYPEMAGFIAMCSVMVVVAVEMAFAIRGGVKHDHSGGEFGGQVVDVGDGEERKPALGHRRMDSFNSFKPVPGSVLDGQRDSEDVPLKEREGRYTDTDAEENINKPLPPPPQRSSDEDDASDLDLDELEAEEEQPLSSTAASMVNGSSRPKGKRQVSFADLPPPSRTDSPTSHPDAIEQRLILQCLLLEAGILFHSVFIGIALSVSTGSSFIVLLIAISFHQTFEGLALGSRIAAISSFGPGSFKPWAMSVMYGITTPIGQAIGLGVHGLYDPEGKVGLLMVGSVNAVSAGLLLYAGLVQLLAEDFLGERSYIELKGKRRLHACFSVVGGAMLMALVGVWA